MKPAIRGHNQIVKIAPTRQQVEPELHEIMIPQFVLYIYYNNNLIYFLLSSLRSCSTLKINLNQLYIVKSIYNKLIKLLLNLGK